MKPLLVLLFASVLAACSDSVPAPAPEPSDVVDPATAGTINGVVRFEGTPPPAETIRLDADPKCVALAGRKDRSSDAVMIGDDAGLANVFVYVKSGLPATRYPTPAQPVVLDQEDCRYVPRVLGLQAGQQLTIRNSDALLHNVRAEATLNETFDVGTPIKGMEVQRTLATREVMVPVKCNVHPWMHAYVGVLEHPFYAVTGADGRFSIPGLPAGTYELEVWHEQFGTQTHQVTVPAQDTTALTLWYKAS